MNPSITLYHYWRSSCSWRVRWAFKHKGIAYEEQAVNLLLGEQNSAEFTAINPGGYVPAIAINAGIFGESMAILEWIEETWPHAPLLPSAPADRLRVRQICQMITSGTQPLQNLSVMRHHSRDAGEQTRWAHHWIQRGLTRVEELVSRHAGTYCFGGNLTHADLCLVPQIYNAVRFDVDVAQFPTLQRINQNCLQLPDCIAASPDRQEGRP